MTTTSDEVRLDRAAIVIKLTKALAYAPSCRKCGTVLNDLCEAEPVIEALKIASRQVRQERAE
ncbi:MAG: hypothetical protein KatS3mg109_1336 [Pirellulaceae bacterium]|nr:MAG: hypothetical protein KatS3mg109_0396 [Pirellulaceae bacterium]GIW90766.1 MAG: hypothetical protein KatS3mg109_1198 [Pirellulaceae bacterium]GIW90904.1 MAG: hypothetical protein KatS3mg109_1336 [Pirellulaceae bacterium]